MTATAKKILSVFLAFTLVFAFTPTVALGEGEGNASDDAIENVNDVPAPETLESGDVDLEPATLSGLVAQGVGNEDGDADADEDADGQASAMTTQDATVYYHQDSGYKLGFVQYTYTPEGASNPVTGALITDVNVDSTAQYDVVIPEQVSYTDDSGTTITLSVVGLGEAKTSEGAAINRSFNWSQAGHVDTFTFPAGIRFVTNIEFANNVKKSVDFKANSHVTQLSANMFEQFLGTTVTLPDSLVKVPASMFHNSNIEQITLPGSVTQINREAFYGAHKLESVTLNSGLLTIGEEAFASEPNGGSYTYGRMLPLASIAIPSSVTEIRQQAFAKDQKLTSLTFGANSQLSTIGLQAFYGTSLTSVDVPDSVTSIGAEAFSGGNGNANIGDDDNPNTRGAYTLATVNLGTSQSASHLTTLGSKAFAHQPITSITLPNSLTSLGYDTGTYVLTTSNGWSNGLNGTLGAFSGCDQLRTITWPASSSLTAVGGFDGCTSLTADAVNNLPSSVTRIDDYAFYNCTSMDDVTIPTTVTAIGKGAFSKSSTASTGAIYTLQNVNTKLEGWTEDDPTEGPWKLGCGYTIRYPMSADDQSDIIKYKDAVEKYEAEHNYANKTKFVTTETLYKVAGTVPEGATIALIAGSEQLQPELDDSNSFSVYVEKGKLVGAVVNLDGYADKRISPDSNKTLAVINANWEFEVTADQMVPLSSLGMLLVSVTGDYCANCNIAVFASDGKLVAQGGALRASQGGQEASPGYIVDEIPAGTYTVVGWQENECFSRISSIGDFAAMGFTADDYAQGTVTVEAGKTAEIKLDIPPLDTSSISSVLATGEVYVTDLYAPPETPFFLTVKYEMTTGQSVDSVFVNIPEGIEPLAAASSAKDYGIGGWDATSHVLTISGLADADKQSGTMMLSLKATAAGSYAVSASLKCGSITAPLGAASVECPDIRLVVPQGTLTSREFTVDVYAKPGSDVELKIGDTVLSIENGTQSKVCKTNLVGHAKVDVKIPDNEISLSSYYRMTATLRSDTDPKPNDTALVQFNAALEDIPFEPTIRDFSFDSAGATYDLAKDGKDLSGGYYIVGVHENNFTHVMPFSVTIDSLQPLGNEVTLYLGMLDESVKDHPMYLSETSDLKSGAKRYVYNAIVPITEDNELDYSEIPCRFDVATQPLQLATTTQPVLTQTNVDALNAAINSDAKALYAQGEAAFEKFYNTLTGAQKELLTGVRLFDSDMSVISGDKTWDYRKLEDYGYDFAFGVFNNSFRHTTWDKEGIVWGTLSSDNQATIEGWESQVAAAFDYLAVLMGDSKPMYAYESFDAYLAAEYGYPGADHADPAQLADDGFTVFYDKAGNIEWPGTFTKDNIDATTGKITWPSPLTSSDAWYAVDSSSFDIPGGLSVQSLSTQNETALTAMGEGGQKGGSVVSSWVDTVHWYAVHWGAPKLSDNDGDIDTVVSGLTDLTGIIGSNALGEGSKACVARGALSGFGFFWSAKTCADNVTQNSVIDRELETRKAELERLRSQYKYYADRGYIKSPCAEAIRQEAEYLKDYIADLEKASDIGGISNFIGTTAGTVGGAAGTAAEALAIKAAAAPPPAKTSLAGASAICGGVSLGCTAIGAMNTIGTAAAGQFLIPNIADKKAIVQNYRYYREYECKKTDFGKLHYNKKPIQDPSGYTFEGVKDNRVSDVIATIYQKVGNSGADEDWKAWNAADYDQENPQITNSAGLFAWDVPEGDWKVLFQKEGYLDVWSQVMHVLPVWTNVAINMLRAGPPTGTSAVANADDPEAPYVDITFDQYMKTAAGFAPTVTVDGVPVTNATWVGAEAGTDESGNEVALSRTLRVPLAGLAEPGDTVTVSVSGAYSYAGKQMASPYSATVTIPDNATYYYVAPDEVATFTKGSNGALTFTFKRSSYDNRTFERFEGIMVDGAAVDKANYTAVAGSVVITPKASYLETLAEGDHTLTAQFADGSATADFKVAAAATKAAPAAKAPATGDRTAPMGGLLAAAVIACGVMLLSRRQMSAAKVVTGKHVRH